jgi:hypothetical protein
MVADRLRMQVTAVVRYRPLQYVCIGERCPPPRSTHRVLALLHGAWSSFGDHVISGSQRGPSMTLGVRLGPHRVINQSSLPLQYRRPLVRAVHHDMLNQAGGLLYALGYGVGEPGGNTHLHSAGGVPLGQWVRVRRASKKSKGAFQFFPCSSQAHLRTGAFGHIPTLSCICQVAADSVDYGLMPLSTTNFGGLVG